MKSLLVFLTFKNTIKTWSSSGLLDRELSYYDKFIENSNYDVTFFSYGGKEDQDIFSKINTKIKLKTLSKNLKLNNSILLFLYSFYFVIKNKNFFKGFDFYKSNQNYGSWIAVFCKFLFKKKFISRCGYDLFHFALLEKKFFKIIISYFICLTAYKYADIVFVPTKFYKIFVTKYFFINKKKIKIIPNFVDTSIFQEINGVQKLDKRVLFIGRLEKQKNIFSILKALKNTDISLDILGTGSLKNKIHKFSDEFNLKVNFINTIDNKKLPELINKYDFLILFSYFEGNPKILIEAMACGVCPIVSNVTGINNIIDNNENGLMFDLDNFNQIKYTFSKLDHMKVKNIQKNAKEYVIKNHDINIICNSEIKHIQSIYQNYLIK